MPKKRGSPVNPRQARSPQESALPDLRPDMMTSDTAAIATLNIRTTALEGRVNELTNAINGVQTHLGTKIDGIAAQLGSKIEERGRPQWAIYIAGAMAVFSVYAYMDTAKIGPLKDVDTRIEARLDRIGAKIEADLVPARTHAREWNLNDERFQRLDAYIKAGEAALTDRVRRVEDQFGNAYSLRDAIQQLDSRMRHFESMTMGGMGKKE